MQVGSLIKNVLAFDPFMSVSVRNLTFEMACLTEFVENLAVSQEGWADPSEIVPGLSICSDSKCSFS